MQSAVYLHVWSRSTLPSGLAGNPNTPTEVETWELIPSDAQTRFDSQHQFQQFGLHKSDHAKGSSKEVGKEDLIRQTLLPAAAGPASGRKCPVGKFGKSSLPPRIISLLFALCIRVVSCRALLLLILPDSSHGRTKMFVIRTDIR